MGQKWNKIKKSGFKNNYEFFYNRNYDFKDSGLCNRSRTGSMGCH